VRPFLILLGEAAWLRSVASGTKVLEAVRALSDLAVRKRCTGPLMPSDIDPDMVPPVWRRAVYANQTLPIGSVDRDAYAVCVLEQLHRALRVWDVFADPSARWCDPRAQLLDGQEWEAVCGDILTGLGLTDPVDEHLRLKVAVLDAAWKQMTDRLTEAGDKATVRLVPANEGRTRLSVERLDALDIPESLVRLRERVAAMLPLVNLPDLLLEVHSWTGFLDAYTHVAGSGARIKDLPITLAALLIAEACNVGLTPVIDVNNEALTRDRLSHVDQNYLRADTHTAANAALIDAQARIPLAQAWGGGLVASVDGLRFVVSVRTINAGPSPKYFGYRKGLTWLNAINDQVAGIGAKVVPGTQRDSLHILDTLLNLDAGPKPDMIATDEASYSDMVFGLFSILGYRFSPRISDMGDARFWRATWPGDELSDYGALEAIARNKVNLGRIRTAWPDMLRVAGSLVTHQVRAYDLLRMLGRDGHPTPLGQAFAEYGRVAKTVHLLAMADPVDDTHRRAVNTQTTVQESRHKLGRTVFHGRRGQIYQAYREGQEDQLGALGLTINAVVLWNTTYENAAVEALREAGEEVRDEDVARLSPLVTAHLNVLGRYSFAAPHLEARLRPLRDPEETEPEP
jgi:TnpA family transposase